MTSYPTHWPEFYTAKIHHNKHLLKKVAYKKIILSSLKYLVSNKKIKVFAYVIMDNHIHLIWQTLPGNNPDKIRHSFMKFTAQQIKFELEKSDRQYLETFKVNKKDRVFQFWQRHALSIEVFTEKVFLQKMDYIHQNPVKAGLCNLPEDYQYSSARFYHDGLDELGILSIE